MNSLNRFIHFTLSSAAKRHTFCNSFIRRTYSDVVECVEEKRNFDSPPPFVKLPPRSETRYKQKFDYFLVLDFEATCDSPVTVVPQEIIEFPVLKVNAETFETESIFHSYVKPVINPELTKFCVQLTGITQDIVDSAPSFEDVFVKFQHWLQNENLLNQNKKIAFATCGDWDLKYMFPMQCKGLRLPVPEFMKLWINIKFSFCDTATSYPRNMLTMMKYCQLKHEGKLHCGLDDCRNIAKVLKDLADRGVVYNFNAGLIK